MAALTELLLARCPGHLSLETGIMEQNDQQWIRIKSGLTGRILIHIY